jgi:hypothetical protein
MDASMLRGATPTHLGDYFPKLFLKYPWKHLKVGIYYYIIFLRASPKICHV